MLEYYAFNSQYLLVKGSTNNISSKQEKTRHNLPNTVAIYS